MSEKTLKFNNIKINKKDFHKSKQAIHLDSVDIDQIVVSDKFKHSEEGFKYFIGYVGGTQGISFLFKNVFNIDQYLFERVRGSANLLDNLV